MKNLRIDLGIPQSAIDLNPLLSSDQNPGY